MLLRLLKRHKGLYEALRYGVYGRLQSARRAAVFGGLYQKNGWDDEFSVSGPGSNLRATEHIRAELPGLLKTLGVKSMLDIPCGDFAWMQHVDLGADYIGGDLVASLIERNRVTFPGRTFQHLDLLKSQLPPCDAVFVRDCLVHLANRDIQAALANIRRSGARFLLTTTFPDHTENQDTVTPYWRALNMAIEPFGLGEPVALIRDYSDEQPNDRGKHLGAWRLQPAPELQA